MKLSSCDKVGLANKGGVVDWMSFETKSWFVWSAKIFRFVFFSIFQVVQNIQLCFTVYFLTMFCTRCVAEVAEKTFEHRKKLLAMFGTVGDVLPI